MVGVSWYEAIAYCRWLSDLTGERICLPTEEEWQRAAQGDTDKRVAWKATEGDVSIQDYCNWDSDRTTPVIRYEGIGDSPYAVTDMIGNVWEWCRTKYITRENVLSGADLRVARGGGWVLLYSYVLNYGATDRMPSAPEHRLDYLGFRCARY